MKIAFVGFILLAATASLQAFTTMKANSVRVLAGIVRSYLNAVVVQPHVGVTSR
jgi:hypothetical protein